MNCLRRLLRRERRFSANKIARGLIQAGSEMCMHSCKESGRSGLVSDKKRTADNQQSEESCDGLVYNVWLKSLENFIYFIALVDCEFDWFGKVKAEDTHN